MEAIATTPKQQSLHRAHGRLFEAESVLRITRAALVEGARLAPEQIEMALSIALRRLEDVHTALDRM
jgi:hypothetical protein